MLAKLRPSGSPLPDFVHTPDWMSNNGSFLPGQDAGFLGAAFDPFIAGDPSRPGYRVPGLDLPRELSLDRVDRRRSLARRRRPGPRRRRGRRQLDTHYRKAFSLISSPEARRAFDLTREPAASASVTDSTRATRAPRRPASSAACLTWANACLLARRLIEAGVRMVTVCTGARYDQAWDTHRQHFPLLKRSLLPMFDRGFSALLEDLHQRGLLDETLVVAMGEFGRTPRVGQITTSAGADKGGRDHWPHCYTVLLAGGGLPSGCHLRRQRCPCGLPGPRPRHPARHHRHDLPRPRHRPGHHDSRPISASRTSSRTGKAIKALVG